MLQLHPHRLDHPSVLRHATLHLSLMHYCPHYWIILPICSPETLQSRVEIQNLQINRQSTAASQARPKNFTC